MRSSAVAVLATGTCVVGFLAGWLVFHSDGTCKVELPPTQPLRRADQPATVELPASASAAQPVATAATPTTPAPPDPRNLPESTIEEMNLKRDAIQAIVNNLKRQIITQRFEKGLFDHLSDDPQWQPSNTDWDLTTMSTFRRSAKGIDRASIPRDQYPDLYVYYDETFRIDKLIQLAEQETDGQSSTAPR
jgi:hypothetical protein